MTPAWLGELPERIRRKITAPDERGCMVWLGTMSRGGYGAVSVGGKVVRLPRLTYSLAKGPIPPGLQIDHLCRVRACCNPEHLEAVTQQENIRRGLCGVLRRPPKTCKRGHDLSSFYVSKRKNGHSFRVCKVCHANNQANYQSRRAAKAVQP